MIATQVTGTHRRDPTPLWVIAALVAGVQVWAAMRRPAADRLVDLQVYRDAVALLQHSGGLYDFAAVGTAAPFTYPPFAALVFWPLPAMSLGVLSGLWSAVAVAVVGWLAVAVARQVGRDGHPGAVWGSWLSRTLLAPLVAIALFASVPVSSNLRFGQVSVLLVALVLLDALHLVPPRWRGLATGIAAAIKLTPLIVIPYFWFSGQRRTAVTAVVTAGGATVLAALLLPSESWQFWTTTIWDVNRVGHLATGGNQSLSGALLRLGLGDTSRTAVAGVLSIAIVSWALVRAVRLYHSGALLPAIVVVGAAGLVVSPVSWTHHQVWLVLAAFLAVSARRRVNLLWSGVVLAVMILPITAIHPEPVTAIVFGNARLWLAVVIAAAVPFRPASERWGTGGSGRRADLHECGVQPADWRESRVLLNTREDP